MRAKAASTSRSAARRAAWVAAALASLAPRVSRATEFEVEARTALQGYEVVDPWGDVVLDRRRFMQTVSLGLYNLQGQHHPGEAAFNVVLMMRLDADFGINARLPAAQGGGETSYATGAG